ncbi:aspartate aminotransferase family protein [Paenibacillus psychroresistens]|uniref:Aspartate aminotransferase family protein n=1 Tax=Paenibacillus psychroresistens TaxID=1778678 RepID=A0A6B8RI53_9BACL|nr:aspartate aminotransferase family protein [Paenibacillus psychroresistens]QGQ95567.1 aspartate aminotransferase family protein [Paenibacillus psychroresistens]
MNTYEMSISRLQAAKEHLAGGVASSLRASMKPTPLYAESAKGAHIRDVDGNEYIDYLLAYGPLILGHAHDGLTENVIQAMRNGYTFGLQHDGEIKLANLLAEVLPCAEKVALSGSGTEAVMLALRLSRAFTGKTKIVRFHGHYHGWSDSIFTSFPSSDMSQKASTGEAAKIPPGTFGQSENSLEDIIILPWNDPKALEETLRKHCHEIAAVITEPVMCNSGCIQPLPGYLEQMRKLTEELHIVMIMDEVITGFRLSLGGAHGRFGILPDLVIIGKAMGGGIAISAVAGKAEIMKLVDDGKVSHLGTLNGNCVSTAAAIATITQLSANNGAVYNQMEELFVELAEGIRLLLGKHRIPGIVNQIGPVFHMMFTDALEVNDFDTFNKRDSAKYTHFAELMLEEGVLLRPNGLWYISTAHQKSDIEATLHAIDRALIHL